MTDNRAEQSQTADLTPPSEPPLPPPDPTSGLIESDDLPLIPPPTYDTPPDDIEPDAVSPELAPIPPDLPSSQPAGPLPADLARDIPLFLLHQQPLYLGVDHVLLAQSRSRSVEDTHTNWWLAHLCTDPPNSGNSYEPKTPRWETHPIGASRIWHSDPISVVGILTCEQPYCELNGTITQGRWDDMGPAAPLQAPPNYDDVTEEN